MSDNELVSRIGNARFTPVRRVQGYDMGDVDQLLDHLQQAVATGEPLRPIVDLVKLRTTKLREGYSCPEVDAFLEEIAGPPVAGTPAAPPAAPSAAPPGPVVQEQKGLLARLFGR